MIRVPSGTLPSTGTPRNRRSALFPTFNEPKENT